MKSKILIIIFLFLFSCSPNSNNKVRIVVDNQRIFEGDSITARLYVVHNDSIAPVFHIVIDQDTFLIPIDQVDNNCGVFKATCRYPGEKEYKGFVDIVDIKNIRRTYYYTIKFTVLENNNK